MPGEVHDSREYPEILAFPKGGRPPLVRAARRRALDGRTRARLEVGRRREQGLPLAQVLTLYRHSYTPTP